MKKIMILLLCFVLIFAMSSCGDKDNGNLILDEDSDDVIISYFSETSSASTATLEKYLMDNIGEKLGDSIVVNWDYADYYGEEGGDYRQLLKKRIQSDEPDDLFVINAEDVKEYADNGWILDLSDMDFVDKMTDAAKSISTYNGKIYFTPIGFTGFGLYWNLDVLEKYNLSVPKNYDEMMDTFDKLKENGVTPYAGNKGFALTVPALCMSLTKVYQSEDREALIQDLATGKTKSSHYLREGFTFIRNMAQKGYLDPEFTLNTAPNSDELKAFSNGEAACICLAQQPSGDTLKDCRYVMSGFFSKDGVSSVVGTTSKFAINANSKNIDVCKQIVQLTSSQDCIDYCNQFGTVSAFKLEDPSDDLYDEEIRDFVDLMCSDGQIPNTDLELGLNYWDNVRDICREIIAGTMTVDQACKALDQYQKEQIKS